MAQTAAYSFSADPRAVAPQSKQKYRSLDEDPYLPEVGNIMYDPRVVRGSTFASRVVSQERQQQAQEMSAQRRTREQIRMRMRQKRVQQSKKPSTPPPVEGRSHMLVQTDDYLEELTDRPPERDETTQTDPLMDRPPTPLFMPAKIGVDKQTQIEPGDLFDFNAEVAPILEVLVGKTLEQSMDEVLEEEELANIRAHKARFEQQRNVELAEVQRLEAEAKRRSAEKERRLAQEKLRVHQEEEVMEKIAARGFAKNFLSDLHESVFENLVESGHFFDPIARDVEASFMPWLQGQAIARIEGDQAAEKICEELLRGTVHVLSAVKMKEGARMHAHFLEKEEAKQYLLKLTNEAQASLGDARSDS